MYTTAYNLILCISREPQITKSFHSNWIDIWKKKQSLKTVTLTAQLDIQQAQICSPLGLVTGKENYLNDPHIKQQNLTTVTANRVKFEEKGMTVIFRFY